MFSIGDCVSQLVKVRLNATPDLSSIATRYEAESDPLPISLQYYYYQAINDSRRSTSIISH